MMKVLQNIDILVPSSGAWAHTRCEHGKNSVRVEFVLIFFVRLQRMKVTYQDAKLVCPVVYNQRGSRKKESGRKDCCVIKSQENLTQEIGGISWGQRQRAVNTKK
jgi:hypothetical protein